MPYSNESNLKQSRMAKPAHRANPFDWLVHYVSRFWLQAAGWTIEGDWPREHKKLVLVAAPHTSNWDGLYMLLASGYYGIKLKWMGKASLTKGPFGWFLKMLGCVPVDRKGSTDMVEQMRQAFEARDEMVLAIPPEGTRSATDRWKSGFYHIAHAAEVPLLLTVLDFRTRTVKLSGLHWTSGDFEAELPVIQAHYKDAKGLHADKFGV